jgi:protein-S-isoprenylcysteine O-methyltransferase Ste14
MTYRKTRSKILACKPPRIAFALLALATLIQISLPIDWTRLPSFLFPGIAFTALGFSIMIRAWWLFKLHETAICPTATTTTFITGDIYKLTRNPMYLGMILMLLGIALLAGSWVFYIVTAIYTLILNYVFCHFEERDLLHQYGDEYAEYIARIRRWL